MTTMPLVQLGRVVRCLDGQRVPLNREQRSYMAGDVPYWGSGGVVDHIDRHIFDEPLVLLGEDGAPFFDPARPVAHLVEGKTWVNNHIHVLRPIGCDPRFLTYSLNVVDYAAYITGSTRDKLTQQEMSDIRVPVPAMEEQRRIADFLDDQVARIDQAIADRRHQRSLVLERPWKAFVDSVRESSADLVPLRRVIRFISDGPFGSAFSSSDYVESGHPVVRLGNIGFAEFRMDDIAYIPSELYRQFPRCHISEGDLLVASLGDDQNHAGRACVAPSELVDGMVKGKCFRAQLHLDLASADYLAVMLSSSVGVETITQAGRGSTRQMINIEILKSSEVPIPPVAEQVALTAGFRRARQQAQELADAIDESVRLLEERKRSLITAAVTGASDVSSVSSRAAQAVVEG